MKRWRRLAVGGAALLAVGLTVVTSLDHTPAAGGTDEAKAAFYGDARDALSGLIAHVEPLRTLLSRPSIGPGPDLVTVAQGWADDFSAAGAKVAGLRPPSGAEVAGDLYRLGATLYARTAVAVAAAAAPDLAADGRQQTFESARRLWALADSVFDAGHRLLLPRVSSDGAVAVERGTPAPVPEFASVPGPRSGSGAEVGVLAPAAWRAKHAADLAAASEALARLATPDRSSAAAAGELLAASRRLGTDVPTTTPGREGAHILRLAWLVAAESVGAPSPAPDSGAAVRAVATELTTLAGRLLHAGGVTLPGRPR